MVKWPPNRGWKGHFESPGKNLFSDGLISIQITFPLGYTSKDLVLEGCKSFLVPRLGWRKCWSKTDPTKIQPETPRPTFCRWMFQLDDEPNLYVENGWKSPNIHWNKWLALGFQESIKNWMGPEPDWPPKQVAIELLGTQVFSGSVDRGSCYQINPRKLQHTRRYGYERNSCENIACW